MNDAFHPRDLPFPATPVSRKSLRQILVPIGTACAAAGAWTRTTVIDVTRGRKLGIEFAVDAVPGQVTGAAALAIFTSSVDMEPGTAPSVTDDIWYLWAPPRCTDASAQAVAFASGTTPTNTPLKAISACPEAILKSQPTTTASDKQRIRTVAELADVKWVYFQYAEIGDLANPSQVGIAYGLSV